jgi:hypothetical protein
MLQSPRPLVKWLRCRIRPPQRFKGFGSAGIEVISRSPPTPTEMTGIMNRPPHNSAPIVSASTGKRARPEPDIASGRPEVNLRQPTSPETNERICLCGHRRSLHGPKTGCLGTMCFCARFEE